MAVEYFVDSQNGSDQAAGTSETQAWRSLEKVNTVDLKPGDIVRFVRGGLWRGSLKPKSGAVDAPITYTCYGADNLPKPRFYGSKSLNQPADWVQLDSHLWRTTEPATDPLPGVFSDVGNLIFDGKQAGVKCWSKEQLNKEYRFWHDTATRHVWLVMANNPAESSREIEAALRTNVVSYGEVHDVVFTDFDIRYGASHGFGGSNTSHITIRNCDISWIGGGHLYTLPESASRLYDNDIDMKVSGGIAVRYGNGIEFFLNAHDNLVEGCRLWEIYDAAISDQGPRVNVQRIIYRNNIIWNCENSYEHWDREEASTTEIVFTNNVCLNAGYGWGHTQRPNPNGCHVLFYKSVQKTPNFTIKNNVFAYATEFIVRVDVGEWGKHLLMNDNIWFRQPGKGRTLVRWQSEEFDTFSIYQEKTGLDRNSKLF
jgi:hypothetical protein